MTKNHPSQNLGFSLIEIILYIGLTGIMIGSIVTLYSLTTQAQLKHRFAQDVLSDGEAITQILLERIRNATTVSSPTVGNTSDSLGLTFSDPSLNPTTVTLVSGKLYLTEGTNPPLALNKSTTQISNLQFLNIANPGTKDSVELQLTINNQPLSSLGGFYGYSRVFTAGASRR